MTFGVITYNVFCRSNLLFSDSQNLRAKLIPKALVKYPKDIDCILIQEIFAECSEKKMDKKMKQYGFKYKSKKAGRKPLLKCMCFCGKVDDSGLKIYSKYPIIEQAELIFENSVPIDSIANKGCLYVKIEKDGEKINVLNTHLQAGGGNDIRLKQLEEIEYFLRILNLPKDEPVIIGGDFNIDVNDSAFQEGMNIINMKNIGLDYLTFNKERNDLQKRNNPRKGTQSQIDHICIHKEHKQMGYQYMNFFNLESTEPFNIREIKGNRDDCCIKECRQLQKYGGNIKIKGLSDHEPRYVLFTF